MEAHSMYASRAMQDFQARHNCSITLITPVMHSLCPEMEGVLGRGQILNDWSCDDKYMVDEPK